MTESFGERLQRLREAAGFTQTSLAKATGVPVGSIRNWEQDRRVPSLDVAARLAAALSASLDVLVCEPVNWGPKPRKGLRKSRKG